MARKFFDIIPPEHFKEKTSLRNIKKSSKKKRVFLFFLILFLGVIIFSFNFFLSRAEIKIFPQTEEIFLEEQITVKTKIKEDLNFWLENKIIPGILYEKEQEMKEQFSTSGKILKEEKARGIIRVYNNYHLTQTLVKNTRFQPPLEKVLYFRTTRKIVIPPKSYVDVEVIADKPGEEYNIGPSTFSVPGLLGLPQYYSVYGKSFTSMKGGFVGEVSQVTKEDLENAQKKLIEKSKREFLINLRATLPSEIILIPQALSQKILESKSSAEEGQELESFDYQIKTQSKILGFKEEDLKTLAENLLNLKIKKENKKIEKESLKIEYQFLNYDLEKEKMILKVKISALCYQDINLENLKKVLLGKSLKETKFLLKNQPYFRKFEINLFPFWLRKIPQQKEKVKIELEI
jgi:hypothetical protein